MTRRGDLKPQPDGADPDPDERGSAAASTRASSGSSVFRADSRVYLVLTGIAGGLFSLGLYAFFKTSGDPSLYVPLALVLGVYGMAILWLRRFEIRIEDRQLIFQSLFRGRQALSFDTIESVELKLDLTARGGPLKLVAEPKVSTRERAMVINAKVFPREAIGAVLALGESLSHANSHGLEDGVAAKLFRKILERRKG